MSSSYLVHVCSLIYSAIVYQSLSVSLSIRYCLSLLMRVPVLKLILGYQVANCKRKSLYKVVCSCSFVNDAKVSLCRFYFEYCEYVFLVRGSVRNFLPGLWFQGCTEIIYDMPSDLCMLVAAGAECTEGQDGGQQRRLHLFTRDEISRCINLVGCNRC